MANNYTLTSTLYPLKEEDKERVESIIKAFAKEYIAEEEGLDVNDLPEDEEGYLPFAYQLESKGLWMCHNESANPDAIADLISKLQVELEADKPFVFSYCFECSKPRVDEFGGGSLAIMPDGSVHHAGTSEDALNKANDLTTQEKTVIYEAARIALADAEVFDQLAEDLDLSDNALYLLRDRLQTFMENK